MPKCLAKEALPPELADQLKRLGQNIRVARKRRRITLQQLAESALTSKATVIRLEQGEGRVSLAILAQVLWVLGLHKQIGELVEPKNDEYGAMLELSRLPKRVRNPRDDELDF